MAVTVRLQDIIDALEIQFDESSYFLNLNTGQVETVSNDLLSEAEESIDSEPDLPEWQKAEWEIAKQIVSTDCFRRLPTKFDVHEWAIMEEFSLSVESDKIREDLLHAIHGRGAFRYFKDLIQRYRIEQAWFSFRGEALKQIAIDWCEEQNIPWR
jgi:hypothetical protein